MCGIIGYYSSKNYDINKALESIEHRGPDNQDYFYRNINNRTINKQLELKYIKSVVENNYNTISLRNRINFFTSRVLFNVKNAALPI